MCVSVCVCVCEWVSQEIGNKIYECMAVQGFRNIQTLSKAFLLFNQTQIHQIEGSFNLYAMLKKTTKRNTVRSLRLQLVFKSREISIQTQSFTDWKMTDRPTMDIEYRLCYRHKLWHTVTDLSHTTLSHTAVKRFTFCEPSILTFYRKWKKKKYYADLHRSRVKLHWL